MAEPEVAALVDRVESTLLGGPRTYTRADVAAATGMQEDDTHALWQALGFASAADDDRAFTDADIAAVKQVRELSEALSLDPELLRAMTRMLGRSFSRLASWQGSLVLDQLDRAPELLSPEFLDDTLRTMQELQGYVWRRQLAAYFSRVTAPSAGTATLCVGFADMAEFTAFTRRSSEEELREVIEAFEAAATDVVAEHGGQLVKMIGDEVLFTADTPGDGAEVALGLLDVAGASGLMPPLRVGLASGPVMLRLGDVFGQTVNIASRLTSLARPGSALVDEGMQRGLADDPRYELRALRSASVRGYHHLHSWRLRRA